MDPNNEAYNIEAEKYHQIARAALFSTRPSVFDDPTLQSVQALVSLLNLSLILLFDYLEEYFFDGYFIKIVFDVVLFVLGGASWDNFWIEVDYYGIRR